MFDSAFLKIERAQEHIRNLEGAFNKFIETHPHTFHINKDPNANVTFEVRFGEAIPTDFSLMLGDAVHNLRTALDHAIWELIGIDGGTQDSSTQFPFGKTQVDYEAACNGLKTSRADTKKFLVSIAAYPSGAGEKFYGLNRLDIMDKHKILTPIIGVVQVGHLEIIKPNGEFLMAMDNCSFRMGPDGCAGLVGNINPDFSIKVDQDAKTTLGVFFGKVEFFQSLPLIETLMDLSYSVTDVVGQFVDFVDARK